MSSKQSTLPPHHAQKVLIPCQYGGDPTWWRIYTKDGTWTQIGPGGKTLKQARQNAIEWLQQNNPTGSKCTE